MRFNKTFISAVFITGILMACSDVMKHAHSAERELQADAAHDPILQRAAAELGEADGTIRERAARLLWSAGERAGPALQQAAASDEPEVALRARQILLDVQHGLTPDTPPQVTALVRRYRGGDGQAKRAVLEELLAAGDGAYPALARISIRESDEGIAREIFKRLSGRSSAAAAFIGEGDLATAEMLLRAGLTTNTNEAAANFAVFSALTGKAGAEIERRRPILSAARPLQQDARALYFLFRITGDPKGARLAAERSTDEQLREDMLVEAGDWAALARMYAEKPQNMSNLARWATFNRLSGDDQMRSIVLQSMGQLKYEKSEDLWRAAKAYLLNDDVFTVPTMLRNNGALAQSLKLDLARDVYSEVFKGTQGAAPNRGRYAWNDDALYARIAAMHAVGQTADALALLDEMVGRALAEASIIQHARLIRAEREMGLARRAMDHTAQAVSPMPTAAEAALVINALIPNEPQANHWHMLLQSQRPGEPARRRLDRLEQLLAGAMPVNELSPLLAMAADSCRGLSGDDAAGVLGSAIKIAIDSNATDGLKKALYDLHRTTHMPAAAVALGRLALRDSNWTEAARFYESAARSEPSRADLRYLLGHAQIRMGLAREGEVTQRLGELLPLGDVSNRLRLSRELRNAGLDAEAAEQLELALRSGDPRAGEYGDVLGMLARQAYQNNDHTRAADLRERLGLIVLQPEIGFESVSDYLSFVSLICRSRALALIGEGKFDEAITQVHRSQNTWPGDLTTGIVVARALDQHDRPRGAWLYSATKGHQESILRQYPQSATAHRRLAWIMARMRRELPNALEHANKATTLQPESPAAWVTLAEVYFQMGQRDQALAAMKKCMELEPYNRRHRAQLERILKSSPESELDEQSF